MTDIRYDNCGRSRCRCTQSKPPCPLPPCQKPPCPLPPCKNPPEDRDIQIDFYPAPCKTPVVWGTVYDDCKRPLSGGLVELLQCNDENKCCCLVVGQTYSDCNGHYEIPIPSSCQGRYRIEVSNPGAHRAPISSAGYREGDLPIPSADCWQGDLPQRGQNNICYY